MAKNLLFFMNPTKNAFFFAIKLWVQIAHKFMIIFCHKLVPKICINLWQKIQKFF